MPNDQKPIKSSITRKQDLDNKPLKKAGDGTMSFMVWSMAGTVLAACSSPIFSDVADLAGGGGGGDTQSGATVPASVLEGPVDGARFFMDDNNNGQLDNTDTDLGTTNGAGRAEIDSPQIGAVVYADVNGALDIATGEILSGVWQSLPYDGSGELIISPLTDLLSKEIEAAGPATVTQMGGMDAFLQDVLDEILGDALGDAAEITVADVLNRDNYNPVGLADAPVERQIITTVATELTVIYEARSATPRADLTAAVGSFTINTDTMTVSSVTAEVRDRLGDAQDRGDFPVIAEVNGGEPINTREEVDISVADLLSGSSAERLFGFDDPLAPEGEKDNLVGIYIQAQSITSGITVMFGQGSLSASSDTDRGVPTGAGAPGGMTTIGGEDFYFVHVDNLGQLIFSPNSDFTTDPDDPTTNAQIRFYVYDGEHATAIVENVAGELLGVGELEITVAQPVPVIDDFTGSIVDADPASDTNRPADVSGTFSTASGSGTVETWMAVPRAGTTAYGTISVTDDDWTFTLNADGVTEINRLDAGDTPAQAVFDVTATNAGGTDTSTLTISLTGIDDDSDTLPSQLAVESEGARAFVVIYGVEFRALENLPPHNTLGAGLIYFSNNVNENISETDLQYGIATSNFSQANIADLWNTYTNALGRLVTQGFVATIIEAMPNIDTFAEWVAGSNTSNGLRNFTAGTVAADLVVTENTDLMASGWLQVTGATGDITFGNGGTGGFTASGQLGSAAHTDTRKYTFVGDYGDLVIDGDGDWVYTLGGSDAQNTALAELTSTDTETFRVSVIEDGSTRETQPITITVNGFAVSSEGARDSVVIYGVEFRALENIPPPRTDDMENENRIYFRNQAENDPVLFSVSSAFYQIRTLTYSQADIARIWNTDTTSNSRFVATIIEEMSNIDMFDEWVAMEPDGAETGVGNVGGARRFTGYTAEADRVVTEGDDLTASGWLRVTGGTGDITYGDGTAPDVTVTGTNTPADHIDTREYTYAGRYGNLVIDGDGDWVYTLGGTTDQDNAVEALTSTNGGTDPFEVTVRETGGAMRTRTEMIEIIVNGADDVTNEAPTDITTSPTGALTVAYSDPASVPATGLMITTLSTTDPDDPDGTGTYTYTRSGVDGDEFDIRNGNELWLLPNPPSTVVSGGDFEIIITTEDSGDLTYSKPFTITRGNPPTLSAPIPADNDVTEDDTSDATVTGGTLTFDDADTGQDKSNLRVYVAAGATATDASTEVALGATGTDTEVPVVGTYGSFMLTRTMAGDVTWTYTLDHTDADTQALRHSQEVTDQLAVIVYDSDGISSGIETITIDVTGANDAPVLGAIPFNAVTIMDSEISNRDSTVTAGSLTGRFTVTDIDMGDTHTFSARRGADAEADETRTGFTHRVDGSYGMLFYNSGTGAYEYVPDEATIDAFPATRQTGEAFEITVTDDSGSDDDLLNVSIDGADEVVTNEAVRAFVIVNGVEFRINADSNAPADQANQVVFNTTTSGAGVYFGDRVISVFILGDGNANGDFSQANIAGFFNDPNRYNGNDLTNLDIAAIILEEDTSTTFARVDWGSGNRHNFNTASTALDLTVTEDDAADSTARGFLEVTGGTGTYTYSGDFEGIYGDLIVDGDGNWTYVLNNTDDDTQALIGGQDETDSFTIIVSDSSSSVIMGRQHIDITVNGVDEAPVALPNTLEVASEGVRSHLLIYGVEFRQLVDGANVDGAIDGRIFFPDNPNDVESIISTTTGYFAIRTADFSQANIANLWNTYTSGGNIVTQGLVATIIEEMTNISAPLGNTLEGWRTLEVGGAEVTNTNNGNRNFTLGTDDADLVVTEDDADDSTASGWLKVTGDMGGDITYGDGTAPDVTVTGELGGTSGAAAHTDTRKYTYVGKYGDLVIDGDGDWVYTLGGVANSANAATYRTAIADDLTSAGDTDQFTVTVSETGTTGTEEEMITIVVNGAEAPAAAVTSTADSVDIGASGQLTITSATPGDNSEDTIPEINIVLARDGSAGSAPTLTVNNQVAHEISVRVTLASDDTTTDWEDIANLINTGTVDGTGTNSPAEPYVTAVLNDPTTNGGVAIADGDLTTFTTAPAVAITPDTAILGRNDPFETQLILTAVTPGDGDASATDAIPRIVVLYESYTQTNPNQPTAAEKITLRGGGVFDATAGELTIDRSGEAGADIIVPEGTILIFLEGRSGATGATTAELVNFINTGNIQGTTGSANPLAAYVTAALPTTGTSEDIAGSFRIGGINQIDGELRGGLGTPGTNAREAFETGAVLTGGAGTPDAIAVGPLQFTARNPGSNSLSTTDDVPEIVIDIARRANGDRNGDGAIVSVTGDAETMTIEVSVPFNFLTVTWSAIRDAIESHAPASGISANDLIIVAERLSVGNISNPIGLPNIDSYTLTGGTNAVTTTEPLFEIAELTVVQDPNPGDANILAGNTVVTNELFQGGDGNDTITTNGGNDVVIGGAGNDTITLGAPNAGAETIVYRFTSDGNVWGGADGSDTVDGFEYGVDELVLVDVSDSSPIVDLAAFDDDTARPRISVFTGDGVLTVDALQITFGEGGAVLTINFVGNLPIIDSTATGADASRTIHEHVTQDGAIARRYELNDGSSLAEVLGGDDFVEVGDVSQLPEGLDIL